MGYELDRPMERYADRRERENQNTVYCTLLVLLPLSKGLGCSVLCIHTLLFIHSLIHPSTHPSIDWLIDEDRLQIIEMR